MSRQTGLRAKQQASSVRASVYANVVAAVVTSPLPSPEDSDKDATAHTPWSSRGANVAERGNNIAARSVYTRDGHSQNWGAGCSERLAAGFDQVVAALKRIGQVWLVGGE